MFKAKMKQAQALIQEKHYDEARAVLKTVNHPVAREWEAKPGRIVPPTDEQPRKPIDRRLLPVVVYALVGSALLFLCYALERLEKRLADYAFRGNHTFTPTQWHNKEMWVAAFPVTAPLLAIRAILLLGYMLIRAAPRFVSSAFAYIQNALRSLLSRLLQALRTIWRRFEEMAARAWGWLAAGLRAIWRGVVWVGSQITAVVRAVWRSVVQVVTAVRGWITVGLRALWHGVVRVWSQIVAAVRAVWRTTVEVVKAVRGWIALAVRAVWKRVVQLWGQVWTALKTQWARVVQLVKTIRSQVVAQVKAISRQVMQSMMLLANSCCVLIIEQVVIC